MRHGFTLIELIVALLVSSILTVALIRILGSGTIALTATDSLVENDMAIAAFYDRFEQDVAGACMPPFGDPSRAPVPDQKNAPAPVAQQPAGAPQQQSPSAAGQKKPDVAYKDVFLYTVRDRQLEQLSFITCNPALTYRAVKPRLVRVTYQLKPQGPSAKTYQLMRRENVDPTYGADTGARLYRVLADIVSVRLAFLPQPEKEAAPAQPASKPGQPQQPPVSQKPVKEKQQRTWVDQWPPKQPDGGQKKDKVPQLPERVRLTLVRQDPVDQTLREYEFVFALMAPAAIMLAQNTPTGTQPQASAGAGTVGTTSSPGQQQQPVGGQFPGPRPGGRFAVGGML